MGYVRACSGYRGCLSDDNCSQQRRRVALLEKFYACFCNSWNAIDMCTQCSYGPYHPWAGICYIQFQILYTCKYEMHVPVYRGIVILMHRAWRDKFMTGVVWGVDVWSREATDLNFYSSVRFVFYLFSVSVPVLFCLCLFGTVLFCTHILFHSCF